MFKDGDILLCKGTDPVSKLIKWGTSSIYSHVAIIASAKLGLIIEAIPMGGVRAISIENYKTLYDLYRVKEGHHYQIGGVVSFLIKMLARKYDTKSAILLGWKMFLRKLRLLKLFGLKVVCNKKASDTLQEDQDYFCSELCYKAFYFGGGLDIVPQVGDGETTSPGDIAKSKIIQKEGANFLENDQVKETIEMKNSSDIMNIEKIELLKDVYNHIMWQHDATDKANEGFSDKAMKMSGFCGVIMGLLVNIIFNRQSPLGIFEFGVVLVTAIFTFAAILYYTSVIFVREKGILINPSILLKKLNEGVGRQEFWNQFVRVSDKAYKQCKESNLNKSKLIRFGDILFVFVNASLIAFLTVYFCVNYLYKK